jgi:AraC family transcriptional activator of pobA
MFSVDQVTRYPIPQYSLYGEAIQEVDERFLHIESISERSRLHDWTIRPHAHRDLQHLLLVQRGGGALSIEGRTLLFAPHTLIEVPAAHVHSFEFRPGTDGWILTVSSVLSRRLNREHPPLSAVWREPGATPLDQQTAEALDSRFDALAGEFRSQRPARRAAAEAWLMTVLVDVLRHKLATAPGAVGPVGADGKLVARYRALIEKNFAKPHRISDYAQRLCVSPERLRQACVRQTASTPLELLSARRLLEAKRCLLYTNMSIALIAEHSGFGDPAYFSRFFARATGHAPQRYRSAHVGHSKTD